MIFSIVIVLVLIWSLVALYRYLSQQRKKTGKITKGDVLAWAKGYKFWVGVIAALLVGFLLDATGVHTKITLLAFGAIAVWFLLNMNKIFRWPWTHLLPRNKAKETMK